MGKRTSIFFKVSHILGKAKPFYYNMRWSLKPKPDTEKTAKLVSELGVPETIAKLLVQRGGGGNFRGSEKILQAFTGRFARSLFNEGYGQGSGAH